MNSFSKIKVGDHALLFYPDSYINIIKVINITKEELDFPKDTYYMEKYNLSIKFLVKGIVVYTNTRNQFPSSCEDTLWWWWYDFSESNLNINEDKISLFYYTLNIRLNDEWEKYKPMLSSDNENVIKYCLTLLINESNGLDKQIE